MTPFQQARDLLICALAGGTVVALCYLALMIGNAR